MSFYVEFTAKTPQKASMIIAEEAQLPMSVKAFLTQALVGAAPDQPIYVRATGHLCEGSGSFHTSTAQIEIRPLEFRIPAHERMAAQSAQASTNQTVGSSADQISGKK